MPGPCVHCGDRHEEGARTCWATGKPIGPSGPARPARPAQATVDGLRPTPVRAVRAVEPMWVSEPGEATLVDPIPAFAPRSPERANARPSDATLPEAPRPFFAELAAMEGLDRGAPAILGEALGRYLRDLFALLPTAGLVLLPGLLVAAALFALLDGGVGLATLRLDQAGPTTSLGSIVGGVFHTFWLHGLVLPVTTGAVTLVLVDRLFGARRPLRVYRLGLWMALPRLLPVLVPLGAFAAVGYFFFALPGLIVSYFFSLVPVVVLVEGKGGLGAMERSFWMVRAAALRMASILLGLGLVVFVASKMAGTLAGSLGAPAARALLGHLMSLVVLPVPMVAAVLVYLDLRRGEPEEAEPFDGELGALRAKLAQLDELGT